MKTLRTILLILCASTLGPAFTLVAAPVHTTYLWHMEQPIYWPDQSPYGNGYETAMESIWQRNIGAPHPENDVHSIFTLADRVAAYQYRPRNSIDAMSGTDAGAQVTYSGGLIRNVASLGAENYGGYSPSWNSDYQTARTWNTSGGHPQLELTVISYHHSFAPFIDPEVLKKDIQIYQHVYPFVWGASPPQTKGFFPPEIAFSQRIIPVLRDCGLDWTFIASTHLSRACANFPLTLGTGGENCNPPNLADQLNPAQSNWRTQTISRGCSPTDAVPFGFQPHRAIYVDAQTGVADTIIVIPVAMAMSWEDGYQIYGTGDIDQIAALNDPNKPMLITLGHDGDNAFGGGYSYYMESVPGFTQSAVNHGYEPTTVPEYLADHAPAPNDIVHVEDGAWINADGDFGDPDFPNWLWPPYNSSGQIDIENGWAIDAHNWAVITAATNYVLTAEDVAGPSFIPAIQDPRLNSPTTLDLAWHFLLGSLNSGYMYYGNSLDMEQKPVVACNEAVTRASLVIGSSQDNTPPTIWTLQQWPHNPGALGFGPLHGYAQVNNPRDFRIWTFVADVNGVAACSLYYRLDQDGQNPLASFQNETYAGGAEVTSWRARAMSRRTFPAGNPYNDPQIHFDELPAAISEQFTYHLTDGEVTDSGGVLVDYYVKSWDVAGNQKSSEIYHTYVGTGEGSGGGGTRVSWTPQNPEGGQSVTIYYDLTQSPLPQNTNPARIHIGHSGWQGVLSPDPVMTFDNDSSMWRYSYAIPSGATSVDFVFTDGLGNWDNNSGTDWHITVTPTGTPGFDLNGVLDTNTVEIGVNGAVHLWAGFDGTNLYVATENAQGSPLDRFIFIAQTPGALQASPWAKAGLVAAWSAFIGNEQSNGWRGWFDAQGTAQVAASGVVEATLDLAGEFGSLPDSLYVCLGRYGTDNSGVLTDQIPAAVIVNGTIESSEWQVLRLKPKNLTIQTDGTNITLRWQGSALAQAYRIWRTTAIGEQPTLIATTTSLSFTEPVSGTQAIYWVEIQF
ncbi:MAG: hypothetical protein H6505_04525 [Calditrichaeota bacterium]|nr:hypothetical protein [Calditrichota bacterium]